MTWKEKRIVSILSTVLALLLAALLIVLSIRYRENRQNQPDGPATPAQNAAIHNYPYAELYVDNGDAALTFSISEEGEWTWADDPSFPLNDETVTEILSLLDTIRPQQTLPMEGGPDAYALESPRATVIGTRPDGSTRSIVLGKATTDGTSYYAMIDDNQESVYILPGSLYELLQTPIYDMCEVPDLPKLQEEQLSLITIQSHPWDNTAGATLHIQASHEGTKSHPITWSVDGTDVTENSRFQSLLEDILALRLERCVDYAPSDGAVEICGLSTPLAMLSVDYTSDSGSEQTLTIAIGSHVTDGSGRYIRINGDKPIYFLPTDLLDPLMSISSSGLNG